MQPDHQTLKQRARDLRKHMTEAETVLWVGLRQRRLECDFRRQVVIGRYIVDFACLTHRTIVECDCEQHDENSYDETRDRWLEAHGWTVLRFRNSQVLGNRTMVLTTVAAHCYSSKKA